MAFVPDAAEPYRQNGADQPVHDTRAAPEIVMIVCHCNCIDHTAIEAAADRLVAVDTLQILTPLIVYRELGFRPKCGGCLTLATNIIHNRSSTARPLALSACDDCPIATLVANTGDLE